MTSKKALKKIAEVYGETNSLEGTYNLFLIIKQDLERLELIEALYNNALEEMKTIKDDDKKLYLKFKELQQENEKLKKAIEILVREKIKPSAFLGTLKNYKEVYGFDMPYEKACILLDCDITEEEFLLLKEVLGND